MITGKIIFLNGISSSGKTTLAEAIQQLSEEPFLMFGIDVLFDSMPRKIVGFGKDSEKGFQYVVDPKTGALVEMKVSPYAISVFSCLPKLVKLLADNGLNVIFDECNFVKKNKTEFLIDDYKAIFSGYQFLTVGVKCDLAIMEQREKSRGDRVIGTAKIFYQNEKNFHYPYDLIVDTTYDSPLVNAKKILEMINTSIRNDK